MPPKPASRDTVNAPIDPTRLLTPRLTQTPAMPAVPSVPDVAMPNPAAAIEGSKKVSRALKVTGVSIVTFLLGIAMIPSLIQGKGVLGSASEALGVPELLKSLTWPAIVVVVILVLFYMIKSTPPAPPPRYY